MMRAVLILLCIAGTAVAQDELPPFEVVPDSSLARQFREDLQRADDAFFDDPAFAPDTALRDSLVTEIETLGLDAYADRVDASRRRFDVDWSPISTLWSYDRVDGLVPAGELVVRPFGAVGPRLRGEVGYAIGAERVRWRVGLEQRFGRSGWSIFGEVDDRIVPFGSNRPFANSLRAVLAGADERDYLRRRGGRGGLRWRGASRSFELFYDAARQRSVAANTEFALLGDLPATNPAIDEGVDRAVEARLRWGTAPLSPWRIELAHRVAGGALSGDFDYARSEIGVLRRTFVKRFELQTTATYVRATGTPPVQRLADVGGVSTVRGHPRRSLVGEESLALRAELPIPYDLLRRTRVPLLRDLGVQFVPWADAARMLDRDAWIHAVGLGVQKHLIGLGRAANVRLDLAVPIGPERPGDVVVLLRFAGG